MEILPIPLAVFTTLLWIQGASTTAQFLQEIPPGANTIQFSVEFKQHGTGQQVTQFQINRASGTALKNWRGDFLHTNFESEGIHKSYIVGTVTAPPQGSRFTKEGYKLFPGLGYYKFHKTRQNFENASKICQNEGAYLAIINSAEEAAALREISKGYHYPWVGVHDPQKDRDFRTIFGTPLNETGFSEWKSGQPDGGDDQFCVYFAPDGLGDNPCESLYEFFCEHGLT